MKRLIIASSLILVSCGPTADRIKVDSVFPPLSKVSTVLAKDLKNNEVMRSSSIVIYPNPNEIVGMAFDPINQNEIFEESGWVQVISKLSYGSRLPRGYSRDIEPKEKVKTATRIVLSMSEARDNFFKEAGLLQKDLDKKQKNIDQLQLTNTTKYACFYPTDSEAGHSCEKAVHEGDNAPVKEIAENCATLAEWKFNFTNDEQSQFNSDVESCITQVKEYKKLRADIKKNKIAPLNELRKLAKGIVTDMLKQTELYNNQRYLLTAATTEDPANDDTKSRLVFSDDGNSVKLFELYLDSGKGFKMYSLENGKIQNLKWSRDNDGVQGLSFLLIDEEFTLDAKLSSSISDIFDLRFVGDVTYREGNISRRGVMKMEFDLDHTKL